MTKYRMKNINDLPREDLHKKKEELELTLMKQRAQIAKGSALENPKMVREIRKNIARIEQRLTQLKRI